jgi:hypothetical protein
METGREDSIDPKGNAGPDDKILREARRRLEAAWQHDKSNRDEALKDLRFLALDQWPESVRGERELSGRPCLTLDHLNQYKNQVVNDIRAAKIELKAIAVDQESDPDLAEVVTALMRDIQYKSHAPHVYATAADGAVSCGIGHMRVVSEYAEGSVFDQELQIKSIPYPLAVYWDPAAILPDRSDAEFCFVVEFIPELSFKDQWPGARMVDFEAAKDWDASSTFTWASRDGVLVAEYWRRVKKPQRLVAFQDGAQLDLTDADDEEILALEAQHGGVVGERTAEGHRIEQYLLTGGEVLEGPNPWAGSFIPVIPVIGSEIHLETKSVRSSLIRGARDAQQLYNYWRSAAAELIALAPKAKWLVTAKQIGARKAEWDTAHVSPKPYLVYNYTNQEPTPQLITPPAPPAAIWQEAALVVDDMKAATGIYDSSLGAAGNETSGTAIARRQNEGDTATAHFNSNLERSLEHVGTVLLDLIPRIYDGARSIRLMAADDSYSYADVNAPAVGFDGQPMIENDLSRAKFDVRVHVGPSFATQRIEAADGMLRYVQADPEALPAIRDIFVKNMDWPGATQIAERLKKTVRAEYLNPDEQQQIAVDPAAQQQAQTQQLATQLELKGAQLKLAKAEADVMKTQAEIEQTKVETQLKLAEANGAGIVGQPDVLEDLHLWAESVTRQNAEQAQGLQALAQAIEAGNQQTAQVIAGQVAQASAQQAAMMQQAVDRLGQGDQEVLAAVTKLARPRRVVVERNERGDMIGGRSSIEEDEDAA